MRSSSDMSVALSIAGTAAWLDERDDYLILTHRRPDGDTVGCAGALAQGLREHGKTVYVLRNPEITPRYERFIEDYYAPDGYAQRCVIIIDTASRDLFPINGTEYAGAVSLCIDHHPSNTGFAEYSYIDSSSASCGEIIYEILFELTGGISAITAGCLYVALTTDTGCFEFANTTAKTLRIASLLVDAGAPQKDLNRMLFRTKTRGRIKIEGMIYTGLEFYIDGMVAISTITRDMIDEAGADEDDMDDISSIPSAVEGVLVGFTIREMKSSQDCKVSVRSSPLVNSNAICERFGGGGHPMAAGFTQEASAAEIKASLLEIVGEYLPVIGSR